LWRIEICSGFARSSAMKDELANFDRHIGASGRATYQARATQHDDLVLALALCIWKLRNPKPGIYVGAVKGAY
jgi:hypothetical protein